MKVGTTALVLDLIEDGWTAEFEIADPVKAIKDISRDTTMTATDPDDRGTSDDRSRYSALDPPRVPCLVCRA